MKVKICCQQCLESGMEADQGKQVPYIPTYSPWNFSLVQIDKWPYFEVNCSAGHISRYTFSNELYDLLFHQATYCIQDGYFRESIGTYHAALERYFEYCIELFCYSNNSSLKYEKLWEKISKHSERQLGAFYSLWLTTMGENPSFLNENKVAFRNKVVHQGKLANEKDAKEYGEYVFKYIRESNYKLEKKFAEHLNGYKGLRLYRICEKEIRNVIDSKNEGIGSILMPSYLSSIDGFPNYLSCFQNTQPNEFGFIK